MGTQSSHKLERHWEEMAAEARGRGCAQQRGGQNLGLHVFHDTWPCWTLGNSPGAAFSSTRARHALD